MKNAAARVETARVENERTDARWWKIQDALWKAKKVVTWMQRSENSVFRGSYRLNAKDDEIMKELECGPMPKVMVALPNIGGALCSTPQSLADAHY